MSGRVGLALALEALLAAGCPSNGSLPTVSAGPSLADIRNGLAERERKLVRYRIAGITTDTASGEQAKFRLAFASPNRMRGDLLVPTRRSFAFDGKHLTELTFATGVLSHLDLTALDHTQADQVLHAIFAPFAPEGFRVPLIPTGPDVRVSSDSADPALLDVDATLQDGVDAYRFEFRLRSPAMDLLREETSGPGGDHVLAVTHERCDDALKLCLPQAWTETLNAKEISRSELSSIELNPAIGDADLRLDVPDGGREETRHLVPADGGVSSDRR